MKYRKKVMETAGEWLEIPGEVASDLPRVEMLGRKSVRMENHRGILAYSPEEICAASTVGPIRIRGKGLELCRLGSEELLVRGLIREIAVQRDAGEE